MGALMRNFIFAILFIAAGAFSLSVMPGAALAKHHHRRHYVVRYVHGRRRIVYVAPRSHGINTNAHVGVGLGPIHVGVGVGGGIHLHEALPPQHLTPGDPPADPPSDESSMVPLPRTEPQSSATGAVVVHPSDCDLECYVPATASASVVFIDTGRAIPMKETQNERLMSGSSMSFTEPYSPVDIRSAREAFPVSQDVKANNYYATFAQPSVANVGGFDVPVRGNPAYFSPFKHGRNGFWYVHNLKGLDVTAPYGVSPRAGPLPESIGGPGYTIITVEQ